MGKRKGLAFLAVAAGAVTAFVLRRRRHQGKETTESQTPEENTAEEVLSNTVSEDEGTSQTP